jgi:hypothetical protein
LSGGNVRRSIDVEMKRNRQFGQVNVIAFQYNILPGRIANYFDWLIILTPLTISQRQIIRRDTNRCREQPTIASGIGDNRIVKTLNILEEKNRALVTPFKLKHGGGYIEFSTYRGGHSDEIRRKVTLHHLEEATQALIGHNILSVQSNKITKPRE